MNKIHKERIKLWIKSLRSSKKQTRFTLKDNDGRCCLGVACDVYLKHAKNPKMKWKKIDAIGNFKLGQETSTMPATVYKWFGLKDGNPLLRYIDSDIYASTLNDAKNLSFKEIANCIRDTFLKEDTNEQNP